MQLMFYMNTAFSKSGVNILEFHYFLDKSQPPYCYYFLMKRNVIPESNFLRLLASSVFLSNWLLASPSLVLGGQYRSMLSVGMLKSTIHYDLYVNTIKACVLYLVCQYRQTDIKICDRKCHMCTRIHFAKKLTFFVFLCTLVFLWEYSLYKYQGWDLPRNYDYI